MLMVFGKKEPIQTANLKVGAYLQLFKNGFKRFAGW